MHFIYCCINNFPPFCLNICEPFLFTSACQFDLGTVYDEQGKQMTFSAFHQQMDMQLARPEPNLLAKYCTLQCLPLCPSILLKYTYHTMQFFLTYRTRIQSTTYNIYYSLPQATFLHAARSLLNILKLHLNPSITHYFLP